ncbi:MAG: ATP-binding cassette domain-containing protein [Gemmatimonadetes bacterium]|nr:ATP-binding cassette domain-containing protein [Gemmatimonadota bacterium]
MSLLTLQSVAKSFGHVVAVDGLSFDVDRGQVVGFLGPNGAGKSTTMRMITQLFEPDRGEIRLDGVPLSEAGREAKRRIGYLPENNPLYGDMLVSEYLDFIATLRELAGPARARAIDSAVSATDLASVFYRPIGELSKGYRQRVGLAQAILHQPDLLILDEPTEGLDPNQRAEIRRMIGELGKDRTVLLSTHVLGEVQQTASRLLIIHRGRIAADGPVGQLVAQAEGAVQLSVEAEGSGIPEALRAMTGVRRVAEERTVDGRVAVRVFADSKRDLRPEIFALAKTKGWTLYELHQQAGSLEDLFRQLTSGEGESAGAAGAAAKGGKTGTGAAEGKAGENA